MKLKILGLFTFEYFRMRLFNIQNFIINDGEKAPDDRKLFYIVVN